MVKIKFNPKLLIFLLLFLSACVNSNQNSDPKIIHKAHLNSGWYPQDLDTLNKDLNLYFEVANKNFDVVSDPKNIKAIIVPHAGFYFSGLCAASVYQNLLLDKSNFQKNNLIKKVIII
jgi:AmmeMemoRadiSam system protein B